MEYAHLLTFMIHLLIIAHSVVSACQRRFFYLLLNRKGNFNLVE